jgi:hypothetical protein
VVAQVHTHPGLSVAHSDVDDEFVVVPTPGFVSIVVPTFAVAADAPTTWAIHRLEGSGDWVPYPEAVTWS